MTEHVWCRVFLRGAGWLARPNAGRELGSGAVGQHVRVRRQLGLRIRVSRTLLLELKLELGLVLVLEVAGG